MTPLASCVPFAIGLEMFWNLIKIPEHFSSLCFKFQQNRPNNHWERAKLRFYMGTNSATTKFCKNCILGNPLVLVRYLIVSRSENSVGIYSIQRSQTRSYKWKKWCYGCKRLQKAVTCDNHHFLHILQCFAPVAPFAPSATSYPWPPDTVDTHAILRSLKYWIFTENE